MLLLASDLTARRLLQGAEEPAGQTGAAGPTLMRGDTEISTGALARRASLPGSGAIASQLPGSPAAGQAPATEAVRPGSTGDLAVGAALALTAGNETSAAEVTNAAAAAFEAGQPAAAVALAQATAASMAAGATPGSLNAVVDEAFSREVLAGSKGCLAGPPAALVCALVRNCFLLQPRHADGGDFSAYFGAALATAAANILQALGQEAAAVPTAFAEVR